MSELLARFKDWLHRRWLMALSRDCHSAAFKICRIGFDYPEQVQKHLSAAKDHLYRASSEFEKLANASPGEER